MLVRQTAIDTLVLAEARILLLAVRLGAACGPEHATKGRRHSTQSELCSARLHFARSIASEACSIPTERPDERGGSAGWDERCSMNQRLIRLPQVKAMVGLGRSCIYDQMKRGEFPKPIKVGRVSGWIEAEVQVWISERIQASRSACVRYRSSTAGTRS